VSASQGDDTPLLRDIRRLASVFTKQVTKSDEARRIPRELIETLRAIGVFRMFAPKICGGLELDLAAGLKIYAALAKIDASLGWVAMVGSSTGLLAPFLPVETYDEIYQRGPDVVFAAAGTPSGTAEVAGDGLRVNGRWPFVSGCQNADWILAACIITKDGEPISGPADGGPMVRAVALPASAWQIEDTWHAAGLKGTGSHHIVLRNKLVPEVNFGDPVMGTSCVPGPLYQAPVRFISLIHASVALGAAEGALDDLAEIARTGRRQIRAHGAMRDSPIFHYGIGRAQADYRAARSYLESQTASHWSHAVARTIKADAVLVEGTQAGVWVTEACLRVGEACFRLGGGAAVYEDAMLQRRFRDLYTIGQHTEAQQRHYADAGKRFVMEGID
jgi:indole-3-acetate monooxygenase